VEQIHHHCPSQHLTTAVSEDQYVLPPTKKSPANYIRVMGM